MESLNTRSFTSLETFWSKYLPIAFLLVQYAGFAKLSLCFDYCLIYSIICLLKFRDNQNFKPLLAYTGYFFGYTIFCVIFYNLPIVNLFYVIIYRYSITILTVIIISQHLDREALYKTWKWVAILVGIAVLYQTFQIYVLHQQVSTIQLIPGQTGGQLEDVWSRYLNRPVAFFTEPAMVVSFLSPILFLSLIRNDNRFAVFLTISIVLTLSTSGLVILAILWGSYLYYHDIPRKNKISYLAAGIVAIVLFFTLPIFQASVEKLSFELSGDSGNAFGRLYSGWYVFQNLDIMDKIFGIPNYDYDSFIRERAGIFANFVSQVRMADDSTSFFFNTAQHVFLRTGVVGAFIYAIMLFSIYKESSKAARAYIFCVIGMMFFEFNYFYHNTFIIQYIVLLSFVEKDSKLLKK